MITVRKYTLSLPFRGCTDVLEMPKGARILRAEIQHDKPVLWALIDPGAPKEEVKIGTTWTGTLMEGNPEYISTYTYENLVYHVFKLDC